MSTSHNTDRVVRLDDPNANGNAIHAHVELGAVNLLLPENLTFENARINMAKDGGVTTFVVPLFLLVFNSPIWNIVYEHPTRPVILTLPNEKATIIHLAIRLLYEHHRLVPQTRVFTDDNWEQLFRFAFEWDVACIMRRADAYVEMRADTITPYGDIGFLKMLVEVERDAGMPNLLERLAYVFQRHLPLIQSDLWVGIMSPELVACLFVAQNRRLLTHGDGNQDDDA
jgi:hypothetical protein